MLCCLALSQLLPRQDSWSRSRLKRTGPEMSREKSRLAVTRARTTSRLLDIPESPRLQFRCTAGAVPSRGGRRGAGRDRYPKRAGLVLCAIPEESFVPQSAASSSCWLRGRQNSQTHFTEGAVEALTPAAGHRRPWVAALRFGAAGTAMLERLAEAFRADRGMKAQCEFEPFGTTALNEPD